MLILLATLCTLSAVAFILFGILFIKRNQSQNIFHRLRRHNVDEIGSKLKEKAPLAKRLYLLLQRGWIINFGKQGFLYMARNS